VTRIHPREQGFDQPVEDRVAESIRDEVADREVLRGGRSHALRCGTGDLAGSEHAGGGGRIGRDAHHRPGRQRPPTAAAPHGRGHPVGMGQCGPETQLVGEADRLRAAGQHRLRADVDQLAGHLGRAQLAAHRRAGLEQDDPNAVVTHQLPGRCKPRDPAADHGDGGGHGVHCRSRTVMQRSRGVRVS